MSDLTGNYSVTSGGESIGKLTISKSGLLTVFDCVCDYEDGDVLRLAAVSGGEYITVGVMMPDGGRLRLKKSFTKNALAAMGLYNAAGFYLIRPGEIFGGGFEETIEESNPLIAYMAEPVFEAESLPASGAAAELIIDPAPESVPVPIFSEQDAGYWQEIPEAVPETGIEELSAPNRVIEFAVEPELGYEVSFEAEQTAEHEAEIEAARAFFYEHELLVDGKWRYIEDPSVLFADKDIAKACNGIKAALTAQENGFTLLAVPISSNEPFPSMPIFCFGNAETIAGRSYIVFNIKNGYLSV